MILHQYITIGIVLFLSWNFIGFFLMMVDKRRAVRGERRIRERTFFIWAVAFGACGILLAMYVFRHKTRHWTFLLGMPILCLANFFVLMSLIIR